ncbi:hypothetical protein H9Y04_11235 [Streptomyces sp. TRM66268-LWL]|uniref:D-isomer specific 2-hydroxyacid dehydrogenase NAD-binding domain-containing protein n=1 Tax=Streptomyces polyasparticus TaxID=2767826 RepID=A0ABR7SFR0_9ACTN|nr:hypothetical protein [Streptomyces polyasparticus]
MNSRPTVALVMGLDTAALVLPPPALRTRLSAGAELWDGVITDFADVGDQLADLEVLLTSWRCPPVDTDFLDAACPQADVELVELDELLRRSDVVTVHAPAPPETRHLLDERRLGLLRDGAILVNTSRGQLIDTEALVRHCASGRLKAVLDVTDPEPLPAGHPLFSLPNVLVTPHIAGALGNEISCLGAFAVAEIERIAAGRPLIGQVELSELTHLA